MMWTVFWLALNFSLHIAMVNLGIFLGLYVPYLKWKADTSNDKSLDSVARKLMRFYAATYGLAGVFATAFTVFLLSFYPDFLGLAGNITLIPFGLAILFIVLHFFAIAAFYYGWDRWSRQAHHTIGLLLAISSLLIPFGFRAVFAFLNIPTGLHLAADGRLYLKVTEALGNPTFWPLYLKSIDGAIAAGSLAVIGGLAYSYVRNPDEAYRSAVRRVVRELSVIAAVSLVIMFFLGAWYAMSLINAAPYKFNNIFASFGWKLSSASPGSEAYDVSWVFALKMIFFAAQFFILLWAFPSLRAGIIEESKAPLLLAGGILALLTVVLGELINAFSQYPYFIACLGSPEVCSDLLSKIPPDRLTILADVLNLKTYNTLATISSVKALTTVLLALLYASAAYFFYAVFIKKE
ncbi:cytochrome ubiquinol oxidase subunit I [Stetteria hydrogenophila]